MDDEDFSLQIAFPDASPSFVNGFEAGMVYQRFQSGSIETIDLGYEKGFPIHEENRDLLMRMAALFGFSFETRDVDTEGWLGVRMIYKGRASLKPNLQIVK